MADIVPLTGAQIRELFALVHNRRMYFVGDMNRGIEMTSFQLKEWTNDELMQDSFYLGLQKAMWEQFQSACRYLDGGPRPLTNAELRTYFNVLAHNQLRLSVDYSKSKNIMPYSISVTFREADELNGQLFLTRIGAGLRKMYDSIIDQAIKDMRDGH